MLGSAVIWRGAWDDSKTYYKKHVVTMKTCVFIAKTNNLVDTPPITEDSPGGPIELANTEAWECVLDNVDLYNNTLSTNNLESRLQSAEAAVQSAVNTANSASTAANNANNKFNKLKVVTESEYDELVSENSVDEDSFYFVIADEDAEE